MWRHQVLGFRKRRAKRDTSCDGETVGRARVGARRVSGRAGVRGHFFYEEMVNVGCFFWAPGPNSNIRAGPGGVARSPTPGRSWATAGICEFSLDAVYPQASLDPQAEDGCCSTAVLPQLRRRGRLRLLPQVGGASGHTSSPGCHLLVQAVSCACDPQSLNPERVPRSPPQVLIIC